MNRTLNILFLAICTLLSCSSPAELRNLEYQSVRNFRLAKLDLKPEVGLDVQFYNPNAFGLTLKDANLELYINNAHVGDASITQSFNVPGKDTFLLPVTLVPDLQNVFPTALQLLFDNEVEVRISGSVRAGRGLFVTIPINYQGRQRLTIF